MPEVRKALMPIGRSHSTTLSMANVTDSIILGGRRL